MLLQKSVVAQNMLLVKSHIWQFAFWIILKYLKIIDHVLRSRSELGDIG